MKKFTIILLALFMTSLTFAQMLNNSISIEESFPTEKTGWYTHWQDDGSGYIGIGLWTAGEKIAMRYTPAQLATMLDANPQLTKLSIGAYEYTYEGTPYNNLNFVLEVYQGGSYDEVTYEYTPGTLVHTQNITGALGWSDIVLSTPVDVDVAQDLMVAISMTGNSCFIHSHSPIPAASTFGNLYYDPTETSWYDVEFSTGVHAWAIKLYIEDEAVYVENSDMYSMFLNGATAPFSTVSELTIGETEDLVIFPAVGNDGPDATSNTVDILLMAGTTEIINTQDADFTGANALDVGYFTWLAEGGAVTITAADLTTMGLTGTFDVCLTVHYDGVDNVAGNNVACVSVTRGTVTPTTCDLEALFMTSNTNPAPIPATLTITVNDDVTVYPGVANNGPDACNTTGTVAFTINGVEAMSQSVDFTGLTSGLVAPLTASGQTITAEDMNTMGLTGTFDVCMSVTYDGTDNVTTNNETCVTITRNPVNVENAIVSNISVFPNPANDVLNVANAENANITIVDMIGNVVATVDNASANQSINISNLANGTYFVRVNGEVFKFNVVK